jgi:hypothetical protein
MCSTVHTTAAPTANRGGTAGHPCSYSGTTVLSLWSLGRAFQRVHGVCQPFSASPPPGAVVTAPTIACPPA